MKNKVPKEGNSSEKTTKTPKVNTSTTSRGEIIKGVSNPTTGKENINKMKENVSKYEENIDTISSKKSSAANRMSNNTENMKTARAKGATDGQIDDLLHSIQEVYI